MSQKELQRLISLTFDENPEIRKKTAKELSALDDPGALFALLELTYDKDESVKQIARKILDKKQSKKTEDLISFSEIFSTKSEEGESKERIAKDKKRKLLHPIELIFEKRLGKNSEVVKKKMMPSLERVYLKAINKSTPSVSDSERKEAVQEFLTTYLDAISDVNSISDKIEITEPVDSLEALEHVSSKASLDGAHVETIIKEVDTVTSEPNEEIGHEKFLENVPDSMFKKAYEIMMYSGGDSKLMKKEMRRMIKNTERDIKLAFKLAHDKFKENKVTKLTEIKERMRNVITDDLVIVSKETIEFKKPRSSKFALRFLVQDPQGNEGVLYLFEGRGENLSEGMKIKIHKGYVKVINDETALTIASKGSVYIVV